MLEGDEKNGKTCAKGGMKGKIPSFEMKNTSILPDAV